MRPDRRITIVMITFNRTHDVLRSLGHLSALPEQPRIIVVDNCSSDDTPQAIVNAFPEVELIRADRNLGAAARTLGALRADSPYVAFCDDDTWWDPGHLARAADLLDCEPRVAIVTARVLVGPENREDPVCALLNRSPLPREPSMPGIPIIGFLAGASIVRRSAYLDAGGFEPRFFVGGEEELLAADLVARNYWICYVPELCVHHYPSTSRDIPARRATLVRNALWFAWLRRPLRSVLTKTWSVVVNSPWDRASASGLFAAFTGLPWALSRRRVLPAQVEQWLRIVEARH